MGKEYIKAEIYTTTQGAEALAAVLLSFGIEGCSIDDPADWEYIQEVKSEGGFDLTEIFPDRASGRSETCVTFWLENDETSADKIHDLRIELMKLKSDEQYGLFGEGVDFGRLWLNTQIVKDDWRNKYKETFRTFSPCEGFVVVPPWEVKACSANETNGAAGSIQIVIDPGMAFGTGSHETTTMCLSRLKVLIKPGIRVLDAGTGSAILAIAAALLGAGHVDAIEIDTDAAASAAGNIVANDVPDKVSLIIGDAMASGVLPDSVRYDLIMANLSCSLLEKLLPEFKRILKVDGAMILSGLLDAQEDRALDALENEGLKATDIVKAGEWLMMEVRI